MKITNKNIKRICLIFLVTLFCLITKSSAHSNASWASWAVDATKGNDDWYFTFTPSSYIENSVSTASTPPEPYQIVGEYCAGDKNTR